MAEEFAQWLRTAIGQEDADELVLIVGVTGKSDARSSKTEVLDQLLERAVFCGRFPSDGAIYVRAFLLIRACLFW